jgi:hypothetical protein
MSILNLEKFKKGYSVTGTTYPYQHLLGKVGKYRGNMNGSTGYYVDADNYDEAKILVKQINKGKIFPKEFQTVKATLVKPSKKSKVSLHLFNEDDDDETEWRITKLIMKTSGDRSPVDKFYMRPIDGDSDDEDNGYWVIIANGQWQAEDLIKQNHKIVID